MYGVIVLCLTLFTVHVRGNKAPDDDEWKKNVLARLEDLEQYKRDSKAEIKALLDNEQRLATIIHHQDGRIQSLEQELIHQKTSMRRQANMIRTTRRMLKSPITTCVTNHIPRNQSTQQSPEAHESGKPEAHIAGNWQHAEAVRNTIRKTAPKRQGAEGISFTAYLDHEVVLGEHQTIKFNQVVTNDGNGYNPYTGVFTCVKSGLYLLYFSVGRVGTSAELTAELVVNTKHVVDAIVDPYHDHQDIQAGNMAMVRLTQGDSVWVDARSSSPIGSSGGRLSTTFSGVFLYA